MYQTRLGHMAITNNPTVSGASSNVGYFFSQSAYPNGMWILLTIVTSYLNNCYGRVKQQQQQKQMAIKQCCLIFWPGSATGYVHFYFIGQKSHGYKYFKMIENYKPTTNPEAAERL